MPLVLVTRVFLPTSTPTTPQARRNPHIPSHTTYTETGHPHQCRTAPHSLPHSDAGGDHPREHCCPFLVSPSEPSTV